MKRLAQSFFVVGLATLLFCGVVHGASANERPAASVKIRVNGGPASTFVSVIEGVPVHITAEASSSSDPDGWTTAGTGVSQGGNCAWNTSFGQNTPIPFDKVIDNPKAPSSCNTDLGTHTFYLQSGVNRDQFNLLKITDASGATSSPYGRVSITVNRVTNHAPIAKALIKTANSTAGSSLTVTQGVPTQITGLADLSSDPDGWQTSFTGVSQSGKCEWNTDFDRNTTTSYERTVAHPSGPVSCGVSFPVKTFTDAPGTYTYNLLRITDSFGAVSTIGTVTITIVSGTGSNAPLAVAQVKADSSVYGFEQAVTQGVPAHIYLGADTSTDPNGWTTPGTGVSQGGKCEWNKDLNTGTTTFEKAILNPSSPASCNLDVGMLTFNDAPGRYIYPVLRITDASGAVSNIASITIVVAAKSTNLAPVAVAKISVNGGAPDTHAYVSRGVPVRIGLDAGSSYDPNDWAISGTGMALGGKCFWNTNLDKSRPTPFTRTIQDPISPSSCNVDLGTLTFNDPPGTYTYVLLRLTDAGGLQSPLGYFDGAARGLASFLFPVVYAQSADGSAMVTVVDGPTPTPDVSPNPSITPTPSCNPFGYNPDCPPPTPTPTILPTTSVEPTITPDPCSSGTLCDTVTDTKDSTKNAVTNAIAKLFGVDPEQIAKFLAEKGASIASTIAAIALALSAPFLASNILPAIAQWGQFLGSFFTIHKRKDRWGIVVDSDLGKPVAQAVVQVFDAQFNQLKETQVTGADGQFGFLLPVGKYYIVASEPGFVFPARKRPPVTLREGEKMYLGEEFEIMEQDPEKIPHIIVPMDREEAVPAGNTLLRRYWDQFIEFIDRVGFVFLFIGCGINTYLLLLAPGKLNIVFEVLYLLLFMLKLYILLSHQRGIGSVIDRNSRKTLDLSIVRLYDAKTNRIVQTRVTNKNGRFFILAPKGEYTASVSKPGYKTLLINKLHIKSNSSKALALDFALEAVK